MGEKNDRKKNVGSCAKKSFLYSHEYRVKKRGGGKNARNNFFRNRRVVRAKNVGKKMSGNRGKKCFLYSQEYRDQKWGENKS